MIIRNARLRGREEVAPFVTLQIVAFPQEGIFCHEYGDAYLEGALRLGAWADKLCVLGHIPLFARSDDRFWPLPE